MRRTTSAALAVLAFVAAGCGGGGGDEEASSLRLGYFPNITHAGALVGVRDGIFQDALGEITLEPTTFTAGPQAVEALFAGALDATYIGPNPAINAFVQSGGEEVRVVAGATSGGAFLVVRDSIGSVDDLRGTTLATPQLGNTQDVALRYWLQEQGLTSTVDGGGDVSIVPQENAQTLDAFVAGSIDGAWVPEPWATRLVSEGAGRVLVDERDLWPDGEYVTTHLVVRTRFLEENPDIVRDLLRGHVQATESVTTDPAAAQATANDQIEEVTGKRVGDEVIAAAWPNLTFTTDPIASSLQASADHAAAVGLLEPVDLTEIYDLTLLNEVLAEASQEEVSGL
jgi:NitT/TauT family transport system substrate-binding protein